MKEIKSETLRSLGVELVVLGTDISAYSLAREAHQHYGLRAQLFSQEVLTACQDSSILDIHHVEGGGEGMIQTLVSYGKEDPGKKRILLPVGDSYHRLVADYEEALRPYYLFNIPSQQLLQSLYTKTDFYRACQRLGIPYPRSVTVSGPDQLDYGSLTYPVVAKAADSLHFFEVREKMNSKIFFLKTAGELEKTIRDIYANGYPSDMIIQEYIPGPPSSSYSMNAYCDREGKVRMMCLGRVLLEDPLPWMTGNHNAIYTVDDPALFSDYQAFLEGLHYQGYGNIDLKYDRRDGQYKALEMNMRLPASMHFMAAGGLNYLDFYLRDLLGLGFEEETYFHRRAEKVWLNCSPSLLRKYTEKELQPTVDELLSKGYEFSTWYEGDRNIKRWLRYIKRRLGTIKHFKEYSQSPLEEMASQERGK